MLSYTHVYWCPRAVLIRVPMFKRHLHHLNASKARTGGTERTRTVIVQVDNLTPHLSATAPW
ncbi:MAG: hypothetical protein QOH41_2426 [Blastocatellia bacterium]|nr:hypothetical protein [Blastocatellia bacterium]